MGVIAGGEGTFTREGGGGSVFGVDGAGARALKSNFQGIFVWVGRHLDTEF